MPKPIPIGSSPVLRLPVDRVAARVVAPGFKYKPSKKVTTAEQATPFRLRPIPSCSQEHMRDLTGMRFGRFTVQGLAADVTGGRWSCRCDCGTYALRKTAAITNPQNTQDRCEHCRHLAFLRREAHYREHGRDKDITKF